jgi:hypothetical protein
MKKREKHRKVSGEWMLDAGCSILDALYWVLDSASGG